MTSTSNDISHFTSFRRKQNASIILTVIIFMSFISVIQYSTLQAEINEGYRLLQIQSERDIANTMETVDNGFKMVGLAFRESFQNAFDIFLDAYEDVDGNVELLNMSSIQQNLSRPYDLYIINSAGVIIQTTYPPDLGLDFSPFSFFYGQLTLIRMGTELVLDRVSTEQITGNIRLYAYMPTPDHEYVLELGLKSDEFANYIEKMNYVTVSVTLQETNPYIEKITVYDNHGKEFGNTSFIPDDEFKATINTILEENTTLEISYDNSTLVVRYIPVVLRDPAVPTDGSIVVRILYDTRVIEDKLFGEALRNTINMGLSIVMTALIVTIASQRIFKPVYQIMDGVNRIATGDLDHIISTDTKTELKILEKRINEMVNSMKDLAKKAYLYLDLMQHDIRNKLQAILLGASLIESGTDDLNLQESSQLICDAVDACEHIISAVSVSEDFGYTKATVLSLDEILYKSLESLSSRYSDVTINESYQVTHAPIVTDQFVEDCINEFIEIALKRSLMVKGQIWIELFESRGGYKIRISDNGSGVPDIEKESFLDSQERARGLGLYLSRRIIEKYGGSVEITDRIEGDYKQGMCFNIWFPKIE